MASETSNRRKIVTDQGRLDPGREAALKKMDVLREEIFEEFDLAALTYKAPPMISNEEMLKKLAKIKAVASGPVAAAPPANVLVNGVAMGGVGGNSSYVSGYGSKYQSNTVMYDSAISNSSPVVRFVHLDGTPFDLVRDEEYEIVRTTIKPVSSRTNRVGGGAVDWDVVTTHYIVPVGAPIIEYP